MIGLGVLRALTTRQRHALAVALGILLYLAYVVRIGGDFMTGRFFTAPLLTAVLILIHFPPRFLNRWWVTAGTAVAIIWLGWQANYPTLLSGQDYGALPAYEPNSRDVDIADERIFYYPHTGLLGPRQPQPWIEQAKIARSEGQTFVKRGNIGFFGYFVGPQTYILDHYALSDALLARLPVQDPNDWRIGHLRREPPAGYIETLQTGQNQIADPQIAAYYDQLTLLIRGPLWTWPRFQAIWRLNTGYYHHLLPRPPAIDALFAAPTPTIFTWKASLPEAIITSMSYTPPENVQKILKKLPTTPGVYLHKDKNGTIIYVGKAINLRSRVRSYFHKNVDSIKTQRLRREIADIEIITTDSELEALLLENTLIKKHRPKYNVRLKDDKRYPYIKVHWNDAFPKVTVTRRMERDGSRYFGPYTSVWAVHQTLDMLRKIFPYLTCDRTITGKDERACLYYDIKLCNGPCIGAVNQQQYRAMIKQLMDFLNGKSDHIVNNWKSARWQSGRRDLAV